VVSLDISCTVSPFAEVNGRFRIQVIWHSAAYSDNVSIDKWDTSGQPGKTLSAPTGDNHENSRDIMARVTTDRCASPNGIALLHVHAQGRRLSSLRAQSG
jgi:hypothetical protein